MADLQHHVDTVLPHWACANKPVAVPFPTTLEPPCEPRLPATAPRQQAFERKVPPPSGPASQPPQPPQPASETRKRTRAADGTVPMSVAPALRPPAVPPPGKAPSPPTGTAGASGSAVQVPPPATTSAPPAAVPVSPMPWVMELRKVHRAFRRMALRFCYHAHNPGIPATPTKRSIDQALAHQDYAAFLSNGLRLNGLTQAMVDGPFAITAADVAWLEQALLPPVEGRPKRGFWTGPF